MAAQTQTPLSILRRRKVEAKTGLSRSSIYEGIKAGTFPSPIPIGAKAVGWVEEEINDWLRDRIAVRNARTQAEQS